MLKEEKNNWKKEFNEYFTNTRGEYDGCMQISSLLENGREEQARILWNQSQGITLI